MSYQLGPDPLKWPEPFKSRYAEKLRQAKKSDTKVLEAEGWQPWITRYFSASFTRPFTKYQREFWEWGWEIEADKYYRPRVECEPRGVGKSTSTETWLVSLLARFRRKTVGYVSLEDDKATQHFNSVKRKLESSQLLADYPHLKPRVSKYRNAFSSWSQDRLITEAGQLIIPITLMGSNRGFKSEDDVRFDLLILDDIDKLGQSPDVRTKNLEILKSEILAAGYDKTLVVVPQNLVHRYSLCSMIMDHTADILSDRDFRGPYPLMRWYDAEKIDLEDGAKRWVITAGEPYDPAIDIQYSEALLNRFGKDTFDRECQQDTTKVEEDKDFREWDEVYHVITRSEMASGFPSVNMRDANGFFIPNRWHVGLGFDWGATRGHPASIAIVTRPDQTCPFDDAHFILDEVVMPRFPYDPHLSSEMVSPGRVAAACKTALRSFRIIDGQIEQSKMSHEASAAQATLMIDLPDDLKMFFKKWKAAKGSGVPQIQNMLEIDRGRPHPFRRYPKGHSKEGEPLMGRPRIFFVVEDRQGELYCDGDGRLRVKGALDCHGLARARFEMPLYSYRNTGEKKIDDDFVDALRGLMATFGVEADKLTHSEQVNAVIPEQYRYENLLAQSPHEHGLTPEQELAHVFQLNRAKKAVEPAIQEFDQWLRPIQNSDDDTDEFM